MKRSSQAAKLGYLDVEDEDGREIPSVMAHCAVSGVTTEPIFGQHEASKRRALATLTRICRCGAGYHYDAEEEE